MKTYRVTARKGSRTSIKTFSAVDDNDAMLTAVPIVLGRANKDRELWGRGRIELKELATGRVINTMEEKIDAP